MNDFLNWQNTSFIWSHEWGWLLLAFIIGAFVGLRYNSWKPN